MNTARPYGSLTVFMDSGLAAHAAPRNDGGIPCERSMLQQLLT